ncbi:MAG: methyltransferase domain-containing protein [Candidatus Thermoplasmatota archaeon]|nr:methyltransferase domain-containing protein [Candidatus Thermoplasmatota archaeon]
MRVSFDRIADRYDITRSLPKDTMEQVVDALEMVVDSRKPILDVGVGTGRFALPLHIRGQEIVGIDISEKMLEKARAKGLEGLVISDVCRMPFMDKSFGVSMSVHLLHLVSQWKCALEEISRVTSERYVSVASFREDSPAEEMRNYYEGRCKELGYEVRHPGLRERELGDLLKPDLISLVAVHEEIVSPKDRIVGFEKRIFSSLWPVPEDVHAQAVRDLREEFKDVESLLEKESIYLLAWKIATLERYLVRD